MVKLYGKVIFGGTNLTIKIHFSKKRQKISVFWNKRILKKNYITYSFFLDPARFVSWLSPHTKDMVNIFSNHGAKKNQHCDTHMGAHTCKATYIYI